MGKHSKSPTGLVGAALGWVRANPKPVLTVATAVIAGLVARYPDFPGAAVLGLVHLVVGA